MKSLLKMSKSFRILLLTVFMFNLDLALGQDCPSGWSGFNNKCWFFSHSHPKLSWYAAESWCQQNNGHLASFATVEERDWVVDKNLEQWSDLHWWIGLNDNREETVFEWSDGTPFDESVANWKPLEPNNQYLENCVEIWIEDRSLNNKQWNDRTCEAANTFVCKRDPGDFASCPDEFTLMDNRCYWTSSNSLLWQEAEKNCRALGANLVSISTSTEQSNVAKLIGSQSTNFWLGLSDTATPGTLNWVDGTSYSFENFAENQPDSPYFGSTCVELDSGVQFAWFASRCGEEKQFVCERGLKGDCPTNWIYNADAGKCYEIVINENRMNTWTNAKRICSEIGAGLLKIQSEDENVFLGSALEMYSIYGLTTVYIGGSDIGHDNQLTWWDQSSIEETFWAIQMPQYVEGRDDCLALYTGQSNNNWESVSCYEQRAFICEIPEGKSLATNPIVTVDGKCEDGWRHFKDSCYLFRMEEMTQENAETFCKSMSSHLTSVLNSDEESFLSGHAGKSWIGLKKTGDSFEWIDNQPVDFENWLLNEPSGDGNCVTFIETGEWSDESCSNLHYFICKKDEIPTDPSTIAPPTYIPDYEKCGGNGWISDPSSDRCYKVNLNRRIWPDAEHECELAGGHLAAINSPKENEHIKTLIRNNPSHLNFWLGANDFNNQNIELLENGWEWTDGSAFNYLNWASGEPNNEDTEDCLNIDVYGLWYDIDCFITYASICEKKGNVGNVAGDPSDGNCDSNSACCFKNIGAEYGGSLPDSALSASSERDQWFTADRGRLNTPTDVIIIDMENEIYIGNGHGAWSPNLGEAEPWLQVDFMHSSEIKGIITQGRNSPLQGLERQWVTSYKVSYSQSSSGEKWEYISDTNGQPIIFDGNSDQNTQVTNLFPRPVMARLMRCHPVTWFSAPCMRLEYIGCRSSCLHKLGMSSGLISDDQITASSSQSGREPTQARAPIDNGECLQSPSDKGGSYRGWISKSKSGKTCKAWASQNDYKPENYPNADLRQNYCRNPDPNDANHPHPWCFTTDENVNWEDCDIPVCPSYAPKGWSPDPSTSGTRYVQIQFNNYFKVTGVTIYKPASSPSYVTSYYLSFSDDGTNYIKYTDPSGSPYLFTGVDSTVTEFTDILRESITTMFVRIEPKTWMGEIFMQFELLGCYADSRATCADTSKAWSDESSTFSVSCPTGCVEDLSAGTVYGTDIYTADSAICPAAIHAGALLNNQGGTINVQIREGLASYEGSYRNKIESKNYEHADGSFVFQGNTLRCQDGWLAWQNHCYYVSLKKDLRTWQNARSHCISMGGDLASILSNGENSFVEGIIYQASVGGDVWIGLNDLELENYYTWSDGSPVLITKWFWDEPKSGRHRCVNIYRFESYWNDKDCDETLAYICKKEKELLPPLTSQDPIDEGCEQGWRAFGSSCYQVSDTLEIYDFGNILCAEKGATQVTINDEYEQAFVHSLVLTDIPPGLGYTNYVGMSASTVEGGALVYEWENGEPVTYTHWEQNEPEIRFSCAFPFEYKGQTFDECTTFDHPGLRKDQPWCSIDPVYSGRWINCGTGRESGCAFMNDQTGYWQIDLCSYQRHYVCEKARIGYTKPQVTTPSTAGTCAPGWYGDSETTACYQINEKSDADRGERLSWDDALAYCRTQGADLVSIHSYEEEQKLVSFVASEGIYSYVFFWVGLVLTDGDAGYAWTDGSPVDYTNWNYGEPNNHEGKELCVEASLTYGTMWNDLNCGDVRNFVCKIAKNTTPLPPPTTAPPQGSTSPKCGEDDSWILFTTDYGIEKCYFFEDSYSVGWSFADRNCSSKGGNLVAIHSEAENNFILSWASRSDSSFMWVGLKDVGGIDGRAFRWSDNSTVDYINWGNGEPNNHQDQEDCAEMDTTSGLWNDDNCGTFNGYICEKYPGASSIEIPTTTIPDGGCPPNFQPFGNKCYWFSSGAADRISWNEIADRCADLSAFPATIQNTHEQAFVTSQLKGSGNVWVGLYGKPNLEYVWFDQSELSYTNWNEFEPNGYSDYDACVYLMSSSRNAGKWKDDNCYDSLDYACYTIKSSLYPATPPDAPDCMTGYYSYGDACYKAMNTPMTRSEAATACQNEGSDIFLMDIANVYENSLFKSWFWRELTSANSMWTGLTFTALNIEGGQTVVYTWDNGLPLEYTNWALSQPDNEVLASGKGCVRMDNQGNWIIETDSYCESKMLPFICKQSLTPLPPTPDAESEGNCDPGFFMYGDYCYYVEVADREEKYRSWNDAAYYCELRGATLASLHSEEECTAIIKAIGYTSHNLFIGLYSNGYTGWQWQDRSPVDFTYWQEPYEPNGQNGEECVEMYPWNGKWNDISCLEKRGYVCKKPKELFSCSSIEPESRYECGYIGIEETVCYRRSCCWDPLYINDNFSGCYHPYGIGPSGIPITDEPILHHSGLSIGVIVGIIAGLLALVAIIGVAVYCLKTDKAKNLSLPSVNVWSTSSTKKGSPSSGGFDNPIGDLEGSITA